MDVKDVALLHVAALLDPDVSHTRLMAWGHASDWNKILGIMRRVRPDRQFSQDLANVDERKLNMTTEFTQVHALLNKWGGQDGFRPLTTTIEENLHYL